MNDKIRDILDKTAKLPVKAATLSDDADLHEAGLTSFASVQLMLALEDAFDIEFPEQMLNRRTFASIKAIQSAIAELTQTAA